MFYIFIIFINNANNANYANYVNYANNANYLLKESQFQLRFLTHHVLVPFRLEHDRHVHILDAFHRSHFLTDVLHQKISRRA